MLYSYHFEIRQVARQQRCRNAWQISKRLKNTVRKYFGPNNDEIKRYNHVLLSEAVGMAREGLGLRTDVWILAS